MLGRGGGVSVGVWSEWWERWVYCIFFYVDNTLNKVDLQIYSDEPCPLHHGSLSVPLVIHWACSGHSLAEPQKISIKWTKITNKPKVSLMWLEVRGCAHQSLQIGTPQSWCRCRKDSCSCRHLIRWLHDKIKWGVTNKIGVKMVESVNVIKPLIHNKQVQIMDLRYKSLTI